MLRACLSLTAVLVLFAGASWSVEDSKAKKKDPPRQMEGPIKKLDSKEADSSYVTITVKSRQPTDKEDVLQEVDKDYRFRTTAATKFIGLDGKPDKEGLKSLRTGDLISVEYKNDVALEVKKLPPK